MEVYMKVMFWLGVFSFVVRVLTLATRDEWPKKKEETMGMYLATMILSMGFTIWCGILLFV